ncbi:MAG: hypothetical protein ACOCQG_01735 [Candidatus Nanoarchaeia archaeon]
MKGKKAAIGMKTVWLILSVIFLLLILTTISMKPPALWGSTKDFACEATLGVLLCEPDDENDEDDDESWRDEEVKFDEFNEALRDENKYDRHYINKSDFEEFKDNIECLKTVSLQESELKRFLFKSKVENQDIYFFALLSDRGVFSNSDVEILRATISEEDEENYDFSQLKDSDVDYETYLGFTSSLRVKKGEKGPSQKLSFEDTNFDEIDSVKNVIEEKVSEDPCGFEIERIEYDHLKAFNDALSKEDKYTKTPIDFYKLDDSLANEFVLVSNISKFDEVENLYLFGTSIESTPFYFFVYLDEGKKIRDNTCVNVLNATSEKEYPSFKEAKKDFEDGEFKENLEVEYPGEEKKVLCNGSFVDIYLQEFFE